MDVSQDEEAQHCTPPNLIKEADAISGGLLPQKSKERYERVYKEFKDWKDKNGATSFSERTVLAYFSELAKKNKPTTLWAYYSMLRSTLEINHQIHISKYSKLLSFLKRQSEGYRPTRAKVFTEDEMRKFLFDAPDNEWLDVKVACIFGLCGACRTDEFIDICLSNIKFYPDMIHVTIETTKTKISRSFSITGEFVKVVRKYSNLRPTKMLSNRFFINYKNGKCTSQVIGKNKFSKMPRSIATYLRLDEPEKYTGHAFCRTSATILVNTGVNMETVKRHGGWKSSTVAENNIKDLLAYKKRTGNLIISSNNSKATETSSDKNCRKTDHESESNIRQDVEYDVCVFND